MDTYIRGFSYMPELNKDAIALQLIEKESLERTWKEERRERRRLQERRLWTEFVHERDLVHAAVAEDPYQFLHELPEENIKELLSMELAVMRREEQLRQQQQAQQQSHVEPAPAGEHPAPPGPAAPAAPGPPALVEECEDDEDEEGGHEDERCTTLQVFREDDEDAESGSCAESGAGTVREAAPSTGNSNHASSKSSENITNILESSIYCARVKELRGRLVEEMQAVSTTIDCQNISILEREELHKTEKRAAEYCARYHRIHLYNLHRQIEYIKRQNASVLPFAKYTHFQAQITRIVALHQNLLQALQVFHKSVEQTHCVPPAGELLRGLLRAVGDATAVCRAVPVPCHADRLASTLYDDELLDSCSQLSTSVQEYSAGVTSYIQHADAQYSSRSQKSKKSDRSKKGNNNEPASKSSKLSMYSTDSRASRPSNAGKDGSTLSRYRKPAPARQEPPPAKKPATKSRRPLMRAPKSTQPRQKRFKENELSTMVQMCSRLSPIRSPRSPPQSPPRSPPHSPPCSLPHSPPHSPPRSPPRSPRHSPRRTHAGEKKHVGGDNDQQSDSDDDAHTVLGNDDHKSPSASEDKHPPPEQIIPGRQGGGENVLTKKQSPERRACDVPRLVKKLCGGDSHHNSNKEERVGAVSGARNAQLHCLKSSSPRPTTTPQLLRILEENIQKKSPSRSGRSPRTPRGSRGAGSAGAAAGGVGAGARDVLMPLVVRDDHAHNIFHYRRQFVQYMLTSPMYANSSIGRPWEVLSSLSEQLIDEMLQRCAQELEIRPVVDEMYLRETKCA